MKPEDIDQIAAQYVLHTLDPDLRREFEQCLATDPALQRMVASWEDRLGRLGTGGLDEEPSAGLWNKIEAGIDALTRPGTTTVRPNDGVWRPFAPGVDKKLLYVNPVDICQSYLLRLAPGARLPPHDHTSTEECLVLEGTLRIGQEKLTAGDYHVARRGSRHPDISSKTGALVFVRARVDDFTHAARPAESSQL